MAATQPPIGGCDFPTDPDIAAPNAPVFWRPDFAPAVVNLVAMVSDLGLQAASITEHVAERRTDEHGKSWALLPDGTVLVATSDAVDARSVGVLIPLDDHWPVRVAAAERLRRQVIERTADPPITPQRRERLKRALRCIDGRRDGATYRAIATAFFGARRVAEEPWKTSSLKAQIARLAAYGRTLVVRGHEDLLRGKLK
ncbi:MAG: DUF2285 domain-containing protein [Roseitalea sp.]|jgi:hypothetical protein|nr:DUF2285 domain-containing protein [Roseitalea sp.]MBO6721047.1 DUF2285 domain-containing protein [Roseitalea sp.]MBO6742881.1 DUF2285 domain-containing protein [Roseitalea sp.]